MPAGVYLYCIGRASELTDERIQSLSLTPADGSDAKFRVIGHGEFAALVTDTDVLHYDIQRESLMAHHGVLEQTMALGDILPVSYGMVASSDDDIVTGLLEGAVDQLHANMERISGRVELSLRVMWNEGQLFEEIVEEVREIREMRDRIASMPENASYYERIQLGEMTSQVVAHKNELERDQMLATLSPLAADVVVTPSNSDSLILNASFLVDQEREAEFDEAVQEVGRPRQERMTFRYLGPLPPANFVTIQVNPGR